MMHSPLAGLAVALAFAAGSTTGCSADDTSGEPLVPPADAGSLDADGLDATAPDAAGPDGDVVADADIEDASAEDGDIPDGALPDAEVIDGSTSCPAATAEHVERWWTDPWTAPSSGDAEQVIRLSTQSYLHFSRALIRFEMQTSSVQGDWTHFGVLRNRAIPSGWTYLAYYGWLLSRNIPTRQIQVALGGCQQGVPYTLLANTVYQVTYDYDAAAGTATLTLEEPGGAVISTSCPATSSLVPVGQGLHLYLGMTTSHPDYPTVLPPWGYTFRNFVADLTPGGPLGDDAPPCP